MYTLKPFGELDLTNLEGYYDTEYDLNGEKISLDLNFDEEESDEESLDLVKLMIENLAKYDHLNRVSMEDNYKGEKSIVKSYLEYHLEELFPEDLDNLIDKSNSVEPEIQLLNKLKLIRVGFYPEDEKNFTIFDYSLGRDITDNLVVIFYNKECKMDHITWES